MSPRGWAAVAATGLAGWAAHGLSWITRDRIVRDGDEEGHVGAAELFLQLLEQGRPGAWLTGALWGDYGEYPPLIPALTGAWWWMAGGGDPARPAVRGALLIWPLVTAVCTAAISARLSPAAERHRAAALGLLCALALPLPSALGRHFMPEGPLTAAVAGAVLAAAWAGERPGAGRALVLGAVLGVGALVKQTFPLAAALPVAVLAAPLGRAGGWAVAGALAVAGPWYLGHVGDQARYLGASAGSGADAPAWAHALFPAVALGWEAAGPVVSALAVVGALRLRAGGAPRRAGRAVLAWVVGGVLIFAIVPKKYPRLLAPVAPGVAALATRAVGPAGALTGAAAAGLALSWSAFAAERALPTPGIYAQVDPRCPQRWVRPPVDDDLGIGRVVAAARRAAPGPVAVTGGPEIPCALQTTHPWAAHLGPALRRGGADREVIEGPSAAAAVRVRWGAPGPDRVEVPALGGGFGLELARPPAPW